jgi:lambda family phage tail tape measure protein
MAAPAGELLVRIAADVAEFSAGMAKASKKLDDFKSQVTSVAKDLGVALSAGGAVAFTQKAVDFADRLGDIGKAVAMPVERLGALNIVAQQSGADLATLSGSMQKLSVNIAKDSERFAKLGISARQPIEALKQLATLYTQIEDPSLRAAVASEAMGKSWATAAPLLAEGGVRIGQLLEQGQKFSRWTTAITEQADAFNDKLVLLTKSGGLMASVADQSLPVLNAVADRFLRMNEEAGKFDNGMKPVTETLKVLAVLGSDVHFVFTQLGQELALAAERMSRINPLNLTNPLSAMKEALKLRTDPGMQAIEEAFRKDAERQRKALDEWQKKVMGLGTANQEAAKAAAAAGTSGGFDMADDPMGLRAARAKEAEEHAKAFLKKRDEQLAQIALEKRMSAAIQDMENKRKSLFGTTEQALMQERLYGMAIDIGDGKLRKMKGTYEDFDPVVKKWLMDRAREIDARNQHIQRIDAEYSSLQHLIEAQLQMDAIRENAIRSARQQNADAAFAIALIGKTAREQERLNAVRQIDLATQERIRAATALLPADALSDAIKRVIDEQRELGERQKQSYDDLIRARQVAEREWVTGARQAFIDYADFATNAAAQAQMVFSNAFRNMEDALVEFAMTGKLNFRDFANSVLADLYRIQVRASITGPLAAALGNVGGGNIITNLMNGGSANGYGLGQADFSAGYYAEGGYLPAGQWGIAGENGPEPIFGGSTGMTVLPNDVFRSSGGGGAAPQFFIDARGADRTGLAELAASVRALNGSIEQRAVAAVFDAKRRGRG